MRGDAPLEYYLKCWLYKKNARLPLPLLKYLVILPLPLYGIKEVSMSTSGLKFWLNLGLPHYGNFSHCWEKGEQLQWIFCRCRCFYSWFKYLKISPVCLTLLITQALACSRPKLDWFEKTADLLFDPLCVLWAMKRKSNALNFWSQAVYWSGNWVCIPAANGWV